MNGEDGKPYAVVQLFERDKKIRPQQTRKTIKRSDEKNDKA